MQIERSIMGVTTLGPGNRLAVWVNGCHRNCKGCVSERLQKPCLYNERDVVPYFEQFDLKQIDGVTISGGEPFDQLDGLCETVKFFDERGISDILIYTGFTFEELQRKKDARIDFILQKTAVLIDGPYVQELDFGKGNLKGSNNQRVIILNSQFKHKYDNFWCEERKMQEFHIGNWIIGVGIPDSDYIENFKK